MLNTINSLDQTMSSFEIAQITEVELLTDELKKYKQLNRKKEE